MKKYTCDRCGQALNDNGKVKEYYDMRKEDMRSVAKKKEKFVCAACLSKDDKFKKYKAAHM